MKPIAVLAVAGCLACKGDSTDPVRRDIGLSFSSEAPASPLVKDGDPATDIVVSSGANTITITRVQFVVRRVKLKRAGITCADDDTTDDDCETVIAGPILVELPVFSNVVNANGGQAAEGTYRRLEFRIHTPGSDAADQAFKTANPTFASISVRVLGNYNGTPFTFTSNLSEKRELDFGADGTVDDSNRNFTIQLDVSSWFKNGSAVIDPATANPGQTNESLVKNNIRSALRAFQDDDRNGH